MNTLHHKGAVKFNPRVLIAEDEPAHAEAIQRVLAAVSWNNVEVVETLADFRIRCIETPPDIALIDLDLPDGRATELLMQFAEQSLYPLIVMTSHGDEEIVIEVMKAGAFDYFAKSQEAFLDLPRRVTRTLREWTLLRERADLLNETKTIYELSTDLICIADLDGRFLRFNPSFQRILGFTTEELLSEPFLHYVHHDDRAATLAEFQALQHGLLTSGFSNRFLTKAGTYRWLEWNASRAALGDFIYAVARDITERKKNEERIHHLAYYDALTQLPNRRLLTDRLRHAMAVSVRSKEYVALLFIDLDNFKMLNDTQGHNVGDLLLIEVAGRLQVCVRDVDTVSRLGGDEFVVMVGGLSENLEQATSQATLVGEKIREAITQQYNLNGLIYHSSASIGISLFSGDAISLDNLLKYADTAMYQAKDAGRNALRFFDPKMQADLESRTLLEADLRYALLNRQLRLFYQMQVDSRENVIGAEALLRWFHPIHGLISPLKFIPIAEDSGLIVPIGAWILRTACAQIKVWQAQNHTAHLQLAVNVSARQFGQLNFVEQVLTLLQANGIDPHLLKLELTESLVLDNIKSSILKMQALRDAGVRLSMDDFGTGQSSLSYLRRLPLDQIKIDQSFIRNIPGNKGDSAIVKTIITMAQNLEMEVIAEGVETVQQHDFLLANGCYLYQGYLFGKPVPIEDFRITL